MKNTTRIFPAFANAFSLDKNLVAERFLSVRCKQVPVVPYTQPETPIALTLLITTGGKALLVIQNSTCGIEYVSLAIQILDFFLLGFKRWHRENVLAAKVQSCCGGTILQTRLPFQSVSLGISRFALKPVFPKPG